MAWAARQTAWYSSIDTGKPLFAQSQRANFAAGRQPAFQGAPRSNLNLPPAMSGHRPHVLAPIGLLLCLAAPCGSRAASLTDQLKWPPGQVPVGQTNGPDTLDDIWQGLYNAWALDPNGDNDQDGSRNIVESIAGTNPFVASDSFRIGNMTIAATAVVFTTKVEAGKRYRVLSAASLTDATWLPETLQTPVSGAQEYVPSADQAEVFLSVQKPADSKKFYKLETSDADSNGDGVSDWVARKLGLNPAETDSNGDGVSDADEITQELASQDVVSLGAENAFASEDGGAPGMLRLRRNRTLLGATIYYTLGGTASAGGDFAPLSGSVYFAPGSSEAYIAIAPSADASLEGGESVTVTLTGGMTSTSTPIQIGGASQASVIISNSTAATGTGLLARYYDNASSTYAHGANFGDTGTYTYTRSGSSPNYTGSVVIPYTKTPALNAGDVVRVTFTGGNLNNAAYNHMDYTVASAVPGTSFTLGLAGAGLPPSSSSTCSFSIQSFPHPAVIERVDATVENEWMGGTPNGAAVTPGNSPDNYSDTFETYLHPATAGSYRFQLDADDKARVLLDLNDGNGLQEILEHGWDSAPDTVGTFKISNAFDLETPASPAARYRLRVEHVETTGEARCRLQWSRDGGTFANIPQGEQFPHVQPATYTFTRTNSTTGTATITLNGHGLANGDPVTVAFSSGNLFTPNASDPAGYSGAYTVGGATTNTFTVPITGTNLPGNVTTGTGCFLEGRAISTSTGVYGKTYSNTSFASTPGRIGVDTAVTASNNGLWGVGTPDVDLINPDTFSIRWTGQVQPQFTEDYTFVVQADDGVTLRINGAVQELKPHVASNQGGSTYAYDAATGDTVVTYTNSVLKLNSFVAGETVRLDPSTGNLNYSSGSTYHYDGGTGDLVMDYSAITNITPGFFTTGQTVFLDPTSGNLSGLASLPYVITAADASTFTVNMGVGVFATGDGSLNISDTLDYLVTAATANTFTVNIGAGKHANGSTGSTNIEIVNKPLKDWSSFGNERYVRLPMVAGARYDIQLDYWENGGFSRCKLSWYSPSQPKQIIPRERLYPGNVPLAPPSHTSSTDAVALVGGAVSIPVAVSNGASASVSGAPPWLAYSGGILSGTPPAGSAGDYQILLTLTDANGTSMSLLNLHVEDTGSTIVREQWDGISGTSIASIPTGAAPASTLDLTSLQAPADVADDFGARIRGYITAPVTGNYYFWIAANDAAELWISNDDEPVNIFKRAWVSNGTAPQEWVKAGEPHQRSPWLALQAGRRYYIEILHKASTGADHLAIGWLKPEQNGFAPSEIVPGYVLSPYVAPAAGSTPGTLYVASMLSQNAAITNGVGTSTLRLSEDETTAIMRYSYSGLTGPITAQHIHVDPYLNHPSMIVYDIDTPANPGDGIITSGPDAGAHKWTITPVGTLSAADIREIIKQGKAYINLHTAAYPAGEIRGNYTLAAGSRTFSPPPPAPAWTDDHATDAGAVRFLTQATFGASPAEVLALKNMSGYEAWIDDQFTKPVTLTLPEVLRTERADAQGGVFEESLMFNSWWRSSITGEDQLRQRVAFALSEIMVVSAQGPLDNRAEALAYFYDILLNHAFGSFRDLLEAVTLTPTMGRYLDMLRNDKPDMTVGRIPNENYAREIKQLFSIGLFHMWPDGTLVLNSKDAPIETYTQQEIIGFAHTFTGWDYGYDGAYRTTIGATADWMRQMREVPGRHFTGRKRLLNNEVLPGLPSLAGQPLDPYAVHNTTHFSDPAYQALPAQELNAAHDQLFQHANVGPFICRQLIQRLVTSHPSRDYLYRVVQKFNDNGAGVRGDMKAVIKAILLDYEARSTEMLNKPAFGKQREPVMQVAAAARAFAPLAWSGTYVQTGTQTITITTNSPHKLASGNQVFLDFTSGSPAPWAGAYSVSGTPGSSTTFNVLAQGWATGTYSIPANSSTCTVTMSNPWLQAGHKVYVDFTTGGANGASGIDGKVYTLLTASAETGTGTLTFAISPTSGTARSGSMMVPRFTPGSFTAASSGLPAPNDRRVTMDTNTSHELSPGDQVQLNFTSGSNPQPSDMVVTVDSVVDSNTWTFLVSGTGTGLGTNQGNNSVYQFPLKSLPLTRSGTVGSRPSTFALGSSDADINQSPLNSPTVFNFFLPDYKFPGALASQGVTTPEFQLTAETSVVRQSNFIYNGIFNPNVTTGVSSFRSGSNALVMDYSGWMGSAVSTAGTVGEVFGSGPQTGQAWTSNANLGTLIDRLNMLLLAGQLPANAKAAIQNLVGQPVASITTGNPCTISTPAAHNLETGDSVTISGVTGGTFSPTINNTFTITRTGASSFTVPVNCTSTSGLNLSSSTAGIIPYNDSSPSDTHKRDRLRTIIHLILTSPDFAIQR